MTLQQLKYAVAIDRYHSFAQAAEALNVTQPTLSGMIGKLEDELGVSLFERTSRKVTTTATGHLIIEQARRTLREADRIKDIVNERKGAVSGTLQLAIGPSIAPYLIPQFIRLYLNDNPDVKLTVEEMRPDAIIKALLQADIDAGIAATGIAGQGILEIPLYTERFFIYLSEQLRRANPAFHPRQLENQRLWVMKDVQCLRDSAFSFCKARTGKHHVYEAGNIDTLIRIVDINGGYTIIPEMHLPLLPPTATANVRAIDGDYLSLRKVSMYIREDYVRQQMLNSIADTLKKFIPPSMLDTRLKSRPIIL